MDQLRICQLITELGPAGAERMIYELATRLDKSRFDVQVVALRDGEVAEWLLNAGIKVTVLGVRGKWDIFKLPRLVRFFRRRRFDILHTHLFHADLVGRIAASQSQIGHLIHTVHVAEARFRPWQFAFARFMSQQCERIVCVSDAVSAHHRLHSGLPEQLYTTIYNGVDVSAFSRNAESRARLRQQWDVDDDQPLAAFVGRLTAQKNIDVLLGAMSHLAARGRPVRLVIAGEGPKRRVVENFIANGEGGRYCRLLGRVDNVSDVLSAADMLLMPSRWEGFGLAAAEAMAASLPVIATPVAGLGELVVDAQTGLLVPQGEVVALAEAIEKLAGDAELCQQLGRAGRARVAERFSIEATIAAHEKLYLDIASQVR